MYASNKQFYQDYLLSKEWCWQQKKNTHKEKEIITTAKWLPICLNVKFHLKSAEQIT